MATNNAINVSTAGIVGFSGTAFVETAATNHAILVGGSTSSTFSNVGPTSTSGQVLQSAGASADPAFSTATYPATAGTTGKILISDGTNIVSSTPTYPNVASTALKHIKSDGTNFVTTTVTYPDASVTAGKVIVSDGTNYIASTPTFPNASATTRKMTVSDGTNWVASTETWAVPGTSGNILTSDGTNWTSATSTAGGGILSVTGTLTNTQIKNLNATPVQVIAAPGSGKCIVIVSPTLSMNYGGTNVFTAAAAQQIRPFYSTTSNACAGLTNADIIASTTRIECDQSHPLGQSVTSAFSNFDNLAINLWNSVATEIGGNAANDNTVTYRILYYIFTK